MSFSDNDDVNLYHLCDHHAAQVFGNFGRFADKGTVGGYRPPGLKLCSDFGRFADKGTVGGYRPNRPIRDFPPPIPGLPWPRPDGGRPRLEQQRNGPGKYAEPEDFSDFSDSNRSATVSAASSFRPRDKVYRYKPGQGPARLQSEHGKMRDEKHKRDQAANVQSEHGKMRDQRWRDQQASVQGSYYDERRPTVSTEERYEGPAVRHRHQKRRRRFAIE